MSITSALAIYFIIWWTVLFAVLPWGVRTQAENDSIVPGSAPSAPSQPFLVKKLIATSILAFVVFGIVYFVITSEAITLDSLPFLQPPADL